MPASLSSTKWTFKDNPDLSDFSSLTTYLLNFISNSNSYASLNLTLDSITYNSTLVYGDMRELAIPTASLNDDILTLIANDEATTAFKVYWDQSTIVADTIQK